MQQEELLKMEQEQLENQIMEEREKIEEPTVI
jgi:hypothetical protein